MKPHDHGELWDTSDQNWLKIFLQEGLLTYKQIGDKLGRTALAVRSKARRLGLR